MARLAYARVSTDKQKEDSQLDVLEAAGYDRLFTDHAVSGRKASRPAWDEMLTYARPGDVVVVAKLDRMGRSVHDLVVLAKRLKDAGVEMEILDQQINTDTMGGKIVFYVLCMLAEIEADMIRARTKAGLDAARARGRVGGRKPSLTTAHIAEAQRMYDAKDAKGYPLYTVEDIATRLKVSRPTVYRYLENKRPGLGAAAKTG